MPGSHPRPAVCTSVFSLAENSPETVSCAVVLMPCDTSWLGEHGEACDEQLTGSKTSAHVGTLGDFCIRHGLGASCRPWFSLGRANVAQHPRDPPDHVEDRSIHGDQRATCAAARHPGQDVPDQVQGPLPLQVGAAHSHPARAQCSRREQWEVETGLTLDECRVEVLRENRGKSRKPFSGVSGGVWGS